MTENGDRRVQTTLLTIRFSPAGLPDVRERRSPLEKSAGTASPPRVPPQFKHLL